MQKVTIILIFAGLLVLTACTSSDDTSIQRQIDERVAAALAAVPTVTPVPTPTPQLKPTPIPFPTPPPTATPQPTPTPQSFPTPLPTATPQLKPTPIPFPTPPPTATPQPTPTPQSFPTPLPTATPPRFPPTPTPVLIPSIIAIVPQITGPSVTRLDEDIVLTVESGKPLAGRDITFTLDGLAPWTGVTVEFFDPLGEPAEWITQEEVHFARADDAPVTIRALYADDSGQVTWLRIATQDTEGVWSLELTIEGRREMRVTYPVNQLQLPLQSLETVGIDLHRYQGSVSDMFFTALVPATLAVDLQAYLRFVVEQLRERLGVQSSRVPDIYLLGNQSLFEKISKAIDHEVGFEAGFQRSGGSRPGIYMRADFLRTRVQRVLTHEYVHLVLNEVGDGSPLPAWLNEGTAGYYEFELGLKGERPNAARVEFYNSVDTARSASLDGTLIPLPSLESQAAWNSQDDPRRIALQYAEAHMAVRFLTETFGTIAPVDMVGRIGNGSTLESSIVAVTGLSYRGFQERFKSWLQDWDDPDRIEVRQYAQTLNDIEDSLESIFDRRVENLRRRSVTKGHALVSDAQQLLTQLQNTSAPGPHQDLHSKSLEYLETVTEWLTLELEYAENFDDSKRVEANAIIPEIDARGSMFNRAINNLKYIYGLV